MGFRTSRRSQTQQSTDSGQAATQQRAASHSEQSTGLRWTTDIDRAEQPFGMTVPDAKTLRRLQHHERTYGRQVQQWVDEGMTVETMGRTRQMEAFRERQADRPPVVPTNIERRNRRSVLRSEQAAAETGSAGGTGVPESVREVVGSTGRSLDTSIQRAMEDHMGDSLGDVRIHTGPQAAAACESINARAFTVGNHVAFNQGEYDPESPEGQHVLAHELAHVRQQTGAAVSMLPQDDVELEVDPDPALEREAEATAERVMRGGELGIQRLADTEVHIQRIPTVDRESTYLSGNRAGGDGSPSILERLNTSTADDPSPSVAAVDLGSGSLAEFQQAVTDDIQTLYEKVEQEGIISQMADAGTGEAIKIGAGKIGELSNLPFGKLIGDLSGAALQAIYENRNKVLEFLGLKSESAVHGDSPTESSRFEG